MSIRPPQTPQPPRTMSILVRSRVAGTRLARTLVNEDAAEELGGLSPHARTTCPVHRRWVHECVASPAHAIRVTGHRWCRQCDTPVIAVLDELAGTLTLTCPGCHRFPDSAANRQLIRSCRASIDADRQDRIPTASIPRPRQAA